MMRNLNIKKEGHNFEWKNIFKLGGYLRSKIHDIPVIHDLISNSDNELEQDDEEIEEDKPHFIEGKIDPKDAMKFYSLSDERTDNFESLDNMMDLD